MTGKVKYTKSSGNVFEDLGFKDAEERMAKAKLAMRISEIIESRGYNQIKAAEILDINQPKVSALLNGQLNGFSLERLFRYLNKLDQDVEIVIKSHKQKKASNHSMANVSVRCVNA